MHELGIVFHVIKSVEEIAQENELTKVSAVTLSIGEVSGIVPSYLTDCWRWAADRTEVLSGSELNIETIHAVTHCDDCGCEYDTVAHGKICPAALRADLTMCYGIIFAATVITMCHCMDCLDI